MAEGITRIGLAAKRRLTEKYGELEKGKRYTVVHQMPDQEGDRYSVLDFLGEEGGNPVFGGHVLAERVTIEWTWIKEIADPAFPYPAWNRRLQWPPVRGEG